VNQNKRIITYFKLQRKKFGKRQISKDVCWLDNLNLRTRAEQKSNKNNLLQKQNFLTSLLLLEETSFRRQESLPLCKYSSVGLLVRPSRLQSFPITREASAYRSRANP